MIRQIHFHVTVSNEATMSAFLNYFSHKRNICIVKLNIYLPLVLYARPRVPILKCPRSQLDWTLEDHTTNERSPLRSLPMNVHI